MSKKLLQDDAVRTLVSNEVTKALKAERKLTVASLKASAVDYVTSNNLPKEQAKVLTAFTKDVVTALKSTS